MKKTYNIDDVATKTGLTKRTIRYYEELGFSLQELHQFIQMNETIEQHRQSARSLEDKAECKRKLIEISEVLHREIEMIEFRMKRMNTFKEELLALELRVKEAISSIEEDGKVL